MGQIISDLTATDRLRTGTEFEIQDPNAGSDEGTIDDLLGGINWDTPSQIDGATDGNLFEVEANTLAGRIHLMRDADNYPPAGWQAGRYLYSASNFSYTTTTTAQSAQNAALIACPLGMGGIVIPKRISISAATGAASNTTAGSAIISAFMCYGLAFSMDTSSVSSPAAFGQGPNAAAGPDGKSPQLGTGGFQSNQPPSQAFIDIHGGMAAPGYIDPNPFASVCASVKAGAGQTHFNDATIYDWLVAEQPVVLVPGTGVLLQVTFPAASTSRTFIIYFSFKWDEWTLASPGDR